MKGLAIFCILLLCVQLSVQIPKYENCNRQVLTGNAVRDCVKVKCSGNRYTIEQCENIRCPRNRQRGYHNGDPNAEYPDCCSYATCLD